MIWDYPISPSNHVYRWLGFGEFRPPLKPTPTTFETEVVGALGYAKMIVTQCKVKGLGAPFG